MEAVLDAVKRNTKGKNEARRLRAAGRIPEGAVRAIAGWVCHLMGHGVPVVDSRAFDVRDTGAALALLDPTLVTDRELCDAVEEQVRWLGEH